MDRSFSSTFVEAMTEELLSAAVDLRLIAKVLKKYKAEGKTIDEFAEEFGCDVIYEETGYGIKDIKFRNDSYKTLFMLKYKL